MQAIDALRTIVQLGYVPLDDIQLNEQMHGPGPALRLPGDVVGARTVEGEAILTPSAQGLAWAAHVTST